MCTLDFQWISDEFYIARRTMWKSLQISTLWSRSLLKLSKSRRVIHIFIPILSSLSLLSTPSSLSMCVSLYLCLDLSPLCVYDCLPLWLSVSLSLSLFISLPRHRFLPSSFPFFRCFLFSSPFSDLLVFSTFFCLYKLVLFMSKSLKNYC